MATTYSRGKAKTVRVKGHGRRVLRRINVTRGNLRKVKTTVHTYYRRPG